MTPYEYEAYKSMHYKDSGPFIRADWFEFESGTIIYGYTLERNTFHIYKRDGMIHRHIYNSRENYEYQYGPVMKVQDLMPSKRAYPDQTLFSFACYCKRHGLDISFTAPSQRETPLVDGEFTDGAEIYIG